MIPVRSVAIVVTAWTVGAATAISVGLLALSFIGTGLTDPPIRTRLPEAAGNLPPGALPDWPEQLTSPPAASPSPTPATPPAPATSSDPSASDGSERLFTSTGGSVVASCGKDGAYLVYWSPAPGYRVDGASRGPNETVRVTFQSRTREVKISVSCAGGVPQVSVREGRRSDDGHG